VFALPGLVIAFTFSGAASRFDHSRDLIVEEANDIGTAYLRIALGLHNASLAVRLEYGLDPGFFGRQPRRLILDGLDDVATGGQLGEFWRNVFAVPSHDSCMTGHICRFTLGGRL
jgi:hypothetical protein